MQLAPIVVAVVSVMASGFCLHRLKLAKDSSRWPATKGRVVASFVEAATDDGDSSESAVFAYEFTVGGDAYVSTDVYPGWSLSWSTLIPGLGSDRQIVRRFPLDSVVDVFYSPADPSRSCLFPGRLAGPCVGLILSVLVGACALIYALAG